MWVLPGVVLEQGHRLGISHWQGTEHQSALLTVVVEGNGFLL